MEIEERDEKKGRTKATGGSRTGNGRTCLESSDRMFGPGHGSPRIELEESPRRGHPPHDPINRPHLMRRRRNWHHLLRRTNSLPENSFVSGNKNRSSAHKRHRKRNTVRTLTPRPFSDFSENDLNTPMNPCLTKSFPCTTQPMSDTFPTPQDYYTRDQALGWKPEEALSFALRKLDIAPHTVATTDTRRQRMIFLRSLTYEQFYGHCTEEELATLGW